MIEVLERNEIPFSFYHIDRELEILDIPDLDKNDALLYVNYFGLKDQYCSVISNHINNLIIDNSMALFATPIEGLPTFYSLRKFIGVGDGAFLFMNSNELVSIAASNNLCDVSYLYLRKEKDVNSGYESFQQNELKLKNLPIERMSLSTQSFIETYDFKKCKTIRERNFLYLDRFFAPINLLGRNLLHYVNGPMYYPLLLDRPDVRQKLIDKKVYIPMFWPTVKEYAGKNDLECYLAEHLVALPVDQRYQLDTMNWIINCVQEFTKYIK